MDKILWNSEVKLILADVDETIADVYTPATSEMIIALNKLLESGTTLFLVSGGGLASIMERITDKVRKDLRKKILIAHCSGAEVWGFDYDGKLNAKPFYGLYDEKLTDGEKIVWREIVEKTINKYKLKTFKTMPVSEFKKASSGNPLSVMFVDRGPQITLEFPNSYDLNESEKFAVEKEIGLNIVSHEGTFDLRVPILNELNDLYQKANIKVKAKLSGIFALDSPIEGVDKTFAIKYVLDNNEILQKYGLSKNIKNNSINIEIWGDKFGLKKGGPDFQMCKAVLPDVRAINFRLEDPGEFEKGYNIVIWNGQKHLHEGLLEYLQQSFFR